VSVSASVSESVSVSVSLSVSESESEGETVFRSEADRFGRSRPVSGSRSNLVEGGGFRD